MSTTVGTFDLLAKANLLLLPLLTVILIGAVFAPWHSVATVDERTYLEMTEAVSKTGVPKFSNGPVEEFPALQARWNLADGSRIWGVMAPGLAYLYAPVFEVGGIRLMIQINIALIALIALGVYDLGRSLSDEPLLGVAAAYVAVVAVPVWSSSFYLTPYSPAIALVVWSVAAAVRGFDSPAHRGRWLACSGFLASSAVVCHLLVLPIALSIAGVVGWKRRSSFAAFAGAAIPGAMALSVLNHLRFGTWNPVSDGPCAWQGCPETGADPQSVGQMLAFGAPLLVLVALIISAAYLLRRRRWLSALVLAGAAVVIALVPQLREPAQRYALLTWAFLIDPNVLPLGDDFRPTEDRFGVFVGAHVVKGLIQGSPFLVLALLGGPWIKRSALLVVPILAQLAMLVLRANMPWDLALGHSYLNFRYLMPVAPFLAILAVAALRDLPWRLHWLAVAMVIAAVLRLWLSGPVDDFDPLRRQFLLRGTIWIALSVFIATTLALRSGGRGWSNAAVALSAVALGVSVGVTLGVDFTATARFRSGNDFVVERTGRALPARFALMAFPDELDSVLSLLPERDIEYLDLLEVSDPATVRDLTAHWQLDKRPVFLRLPGDSEFSLGPGLEADVVDPEVGLLLLRSVPIQQP